ncbi:LOW QUALITY PROTEIN: nuclear protein MDM1 [Pelodytes ibericus]
MPVHFKGLSEYDRNFKWKMSDGQDEEPGHVSKWAGLRSDELGITKEPSFTSKRQVPHYKPQISKSFQWKEEVENNGHVKTAKPVKLHSNIVKEPLVEEESHTPDAPRIPKQPSYLSAASQVQSIKNDTKLGKLSVNIPEQNNTEDAASRVGPEKQTRGFHRVLQKKAGLKTVPSQHPLRMSEYRRQFEKKTPFENSPLLDAEQVMHNKNQAIPPFRVKPVITETEYNRQFKGSPPAKGPKLRKNWEEKYVTEYEPENYIPKRKDKKKNSKHKTSSSAKVGKSETEQNQMVEKEILKERLVQQLDIPSKGYRRVKTEYSANFLSPSEYKYKDGAWVRATKEMLGQGSHLSLDSMWVAEVKELREKAEYYKHRAQGTHFSREHLNQILSPCNKLWDVSSNSSSEEQVSNNIQALDLAGLQSSSRKERLHEPQVKTKQTSNTGNLGLSDVPTTPLRRRLVWDEDQDTEPMQDAVALCLEDEHAGTDEMQDVEENEEEDTESKIENITKRVESSKINQQENGSVSVYSDISGRLPTPKLKTLGQVQRTHHDLTTPASGGALLVSPTKHHDRRSEHKKIGASDKTVSKEYFTTLPKKSEEKSSSSPPVAGIQTVDPIPLWQDKWATTHAPDKPSSPVLSNPVNTSPVMKPFVSAPQRWSPSCRIHGALRNPEFQHNGDFGNPNFYKIPLSDDQSIEDDRLSQISARSAASSSFASQILERAQKRKEHFWGKK